MRKTLIFLTFIFFIIAITGIIFAEEIEESRGGPIKYGTCGDNICDYGENTSSYPYYCPQDCDNSEEDEIVFCTMDVKMCFDGSYVGRDPENNCEFHPCANEEELDEQEEISCKNLYWIDNTNKTCSQKEFCGAYMYYGLYTFETKERCLNFLEEDEKLEENETDNDLDDENEEELLGSSCGTVTPGYQDQCCQRKGYEGWDEEEFKCIGERNKENIRERIRFQNGSPKNEIECPEECVCSGSNVKCSFENGTRIMTVYAGNSGNVIVQVKNVNASTNITLYKEDGKIYGTFKDNKTKEIILPDEAMDKLKKRHQKRLQLYNESINLTEEGYYLIQTKKKARLFWLIPVKEHMNAEIDAETGEIIKIRNPWWGFLARDIREKNNSTETED